MSGLCVLYVLLLTVYSASLLPKKQTREVKLHFPEKNKKNVNHYSLEFLLSHITKKKEETLLLQSK